MPAQAGIQGREGMDTGFHRYDGRLIPVRCQIVPVLVFSKKETKITKVLVACAARTGQFRNLSQSAKALSDGPRPIIPSGCEGSRKDFSLWSK